ncbi:MAG: TPM domain-containing protein, partial [Firmicutes bacterium]|nr:TPM domain-containing protein [Bacillota bacterium]
MQQKRRILGLMFILLLVFVRPLATAAAPEFPQPLGLVSDFAQVLSVQERVEIQLIAERLWQSNGVELANVTVTDTSPYDTETYAFRLFRAWGIGEAKVDNGLLVLLNMGEREIRIEVGTGLEGYITDAKAGRILDAALPQLQAGQYGQGLLVIAEQLAEVVAEAPGEGKELG